MSYARLGQDGSNVYVFMAIEGWLECHWCNLEPGPRDYRAHCTTDMYQHLLQHKKRGDVVPDYVFTEIVMDDGENFPKEDA